MKTIIFVSNSTWGYGADYSMISILNYLKKKGIKPYVIIPGEGRSAELLRKNDIDFICIKFKGCVNKNTWFGIKPILKYIINKLVLCRTLRLLKKEEDIIGVYNNGYTNYFSVMLAKKLKVPHIQHVREFGGKDFGWKYDKIASKLVNKYSSKIISISEAVKNTYNNIFDKEKLIKIYNGIRVPERLEKKAINEKINIIMTGRLSNEKSQITLIKAIKEIVSKENNNNFCVDLYGDGEDREILEKYVKDNKLQDYIHFKGYQYEIDFSKYQIGIICSKSEGFGRVTVEYMMNELAVIASNTGANPEIVIDNITGELFEYSNYIQLEEKIVKLLNDKQKIQEYGENGRRRALENFTEDIYVRNIYKVCKKCYDI